MIYEILTISIMEEIPIPMVLITTTIRTIPEVTEIITGAVITIRTFEIEVLEETTTMVTTIIQMVTITTMVPMEIIAITIRTGMEIMEIMEISPITMVIVAEVIMPILVMVTTAMVTTTTDPMVIPILEEIPDAMAVAMVIPMVATTTILLNIKTTTKQKSNVTDVTALVIMHGNARIEVLTMVPRMVTPSWLWASLNRVQNQPIQSQVFESREFQNQYSMPTAPPLSRRILPQQQQFHNSHQSILQQPLNFNGSM